MSDSSSFDLPPSTHPPASALLCFDFDGTLVHHDLDPPFAAALGALLVKARKNGARWLINTGRSLSHALDGVQTYGLPGEPDYIVAREHELFARDDAGRWIDAGEWNDRCRIAHDTFFEEHADVLGEVRSFTESRNLAWWVDDRVDPAGLVAHGEPEMEEIVTFIEKCRPSYPTLGYHRNSVWMRFTHINFNKGSALAELTRQLGLTSERVFAAGDNLNDLPMLRRQFAAGLCCPSNALDEVKLHVRSEGGHVAGLPGSAGVAEGLATFLKGLKLA